jgi:aryl-phospho-beta-D-glucosidase BglC (GH1 family)
MEFGKDPAPGQFKNCFCATSLYKAPVPPLHTEKTSIVDAQGHNVTLSCANWFGAQLSTYVPQGLDKAPLDYISKTIASLGFNCVRLPYSLELYLSNPEVENQNVAANEELKE